MAFKALDFRGDRYLTPALPAALALVLVTVAEATALLRRRIPAGLAAKEVAHQGLTRLDVVTTMHERKQRMSDAAVGFIALSGGYA